MFTAIFVHSTKMMSTNKSHKNTSAFLYKIQSSDMRVSQLITSSLHCNAESVIFSLWPAKWNMLLRFCLFDINSTGPDRALLCAVVYLLKWGALLSFTQRVIWPLKLINYLCWLNHLVNEVSQSAGCSTALGANLYLFLSLTHLVNFSYLASLHCSVSLYKLWIVRFINLHKKGFEIQGWNAQCQYCAITVNASFRSLMLVCI